MIYARQGLPGSGMTLDYGDSSPLNVEPSKLALAGKTGAGVSTSNLDKTRMRIVRTGQTCDWGGLRIRVVRVRLGVAYGHTLYQKNPVVADCASLRVLHG